MSAMARALAPDLGGWAAGLASLPYEWRAFLAPWAERIATAVGPLRTRDVLGGGAPRGFSGLARRGPYDRLLLTEWLLADELPEEFMRRAVMSEHTFLAVERSEPRGALSCAVLLDSGPDQLGAPRLAQLAALVALGRRAEAAGAEFRFGVLQDATTTLYATLDASAIRAILDARTIEIPADAHLEPWGWLLGSEPLPEDVWLLGGAMLGGTLDVEDTALLGWEGRSADDSLGREIAVANLDGDGLPDLVVGSPASDSSGGRVYFLLSSDW